jgi:VanZ family protein
MIAAFGRLPRPLRIAVVSAAVSVLLFVSLTPSDELPVATLIWDKAEHAVSYLVLMMVGLLFAPRRLLAFTVFAFCLGVAVEFLQGAMGFGRDADWHDVVANSTGIAAGFLIWRLLIPRRKAA